MASAVHMASDDEGRSRALENLLAQQPADTIEEFAAQQAKLMGDSYTWDLWGAAHVINGGCSNDGFDYFRGWLLLRGRAVWEHALKDPESLITTSSDGNAECEDVLYAAAAAYERVAGHPLGFATGVSSGEPAGTPWEEGDLASRYPKLSVKHGTATIDPERTAAANAETRAVFDMSAGLERLARSQPEQALQLFTIARDVAPREVTRMLATNNMAWSNLIIGTPEALRAALPLALEAARSMDALPEGNRTDSVRGTLAFAMILNGRAAEGVELIEGLLDLGPEIPGLRAVRLCILAIGLAHLGQRERARQVLDQAFTADARCSLLPRARAVINA